MNPENWPGSFKIPSARQNRARQGGSSWEVGWEVKLGGLGHNKNAMHKLQLDSEFKKIV